VFDFCEHDLAGLLSNVNVKFSLGEVKKVMQQLLNGLYYIHSNKVGIDSELRILEFCESLYVQQSTSDTHHKY
jgi:serine/threonine protein kinase